ncbi:toxin-antitoxin system, toxin component domain protein [Corynebacterium genitalium ATCC 33030]|uniref:Toxin-antitoxin system, toxin component domain protein n=2 Tax=Corynebacterium genitalium TaxID=38288 RepID=D7W9G5_9CORY|nr:toxin-antitoxin system, toxin component domain protein [Corynebacterium genitalium ATCC 33030]
MARITPCLENRKIARYLPENAAEKAAGSTEFIVLRGKPGVTITDFAYYFATTPDIHDLSVSLMTGTSGRQRVDIDALCATQVTIPDLRTQHSIVSILGSLDDKIAANTRVINSSITLAESLVDRGIRSTRVRLGDVARITMGTSPKGEYLKEEVGGLPFYQGVRDFDDLTPQKRVFTENPVREAEAGDILFAVRAPVGEVNIASEPTAIGRGLAAIRGLNNHVALFYLLRSHPKIWNTHQDNGTVFASINKTDLSNALIPEIEMDQSQYDLLAKLHNQSLVLTSQNFILAKTRDELLPLLMSGKITVREAKQETAAAGVNIAGEEHEA